MPKRANPKAMKDTFARVIKASVIYQTDTATNSQSVVG